MQFNSNQQMLDMYEKGVYSPILQSEPDELMLMGIRYALFAYLMNDFLNNIRLTIMKIYVKLSNALGVLLALFFAVNAAATELPKGFSEAVQQLEKHRINAEHWANVLKGLQDKNPEKTFLFAKNLYQEGRVAVDAWLKKTKVDLITNQQINENDYRSLLEDVGVKTRTFMEFVYGLANEDQTRGWQDIIPDTINSVVDNGLKLWREFRSVKKEEREELLKVLDSLSWKSWEEIPAK